MWVNKQKLKPYIEQWIGSKLGKEYDKAVYWPPAPSCKMPSWMNHKLESKLQGEILATSYYADDAILMAESGSGLIIKSWQTLVIPLTLACQAPLSMVFSRQEYWSGLPFPSPEDLPGPGIKPRSPALQADSLPNKLWEKSCGRRWEASWWGWMRRMKKLTKNSPFRKVGSWHLVPYFLANRRVKSRRRDIFYFLGL